MKNIINIYYNEDKLYEITYSDNTSIILDEKKMLRELARYINENNITTLKELVDDIISHHDEETKENTFINTKDIKNKSKLFNKALKLSQKNKLESFDIYQITIHDDYTYIEYTYNYEHETLFDTTITQKITNDKLKDVLLDYAKYNKIYTKEDLYDADIIFVTSDKTDKWLTNLMDNEIEESLSELKLEESENFEDVLDYADKKFEKALNKEKVLDDSVDTILNNVETDLSLEVNNILNEKEITRIDYFTDLLTARITYSDGTIEKCNIKDMNIILEKLINEKSANEINNILNFYTRKGNEYKSVSYAEYKNDKKQLEEDLNKKDIGKVVLYSFDAENEEKKTQGCIFYTDGSVKNTLADEAVNEAINYSKENNIDLTDTKNQLVDYTDGKTFEKNFKKYRREAMGIKNRIIEFGKKIKQSKVVRAAMIVVAAGIAMISALKISSNQNDDTIRYQAEQEINNEDDTTLDNDYNEQIVASEKDNLDKEENKEEVKEEEKQEKQEKQEKIVEAKVEEEKTVVEDNSNKEKSTYKEDYTYANINYDSENDVVYSNLTVYNDEALLNYYNSIVPTTYDQIPERHIETVLYEQPTIENNIYERTIGVNVEENTNSYVEEGFDTIYPEDVTKVIDEAGNDITNEVIADQIINQLENSEIVDNSQKTL